MHKSLGTNNVFKPISNSHKCNSQKTTKRFRIPEEFAQRIAVDSLASQTIDNPFTQTKQKVIKKFQCNAIFSGTKQRGKKEKKRTMRTLRRSSVSEAMRPLLGRPKRISVRWRTPASSNGPFTSATWDCCDGAQHTKTVRLKGNESVEPERHGWSIDMDIAFSLCYSSSSVCVTVFEREREKWLKRRRFRGKIGKNK